MPLANTEPSRRLSIMRHFQIMYVMVAFMGSFLLYTFPNMISVDAAEQTEQSQNTDYALRYDMTTNKTLIDELRGEHLSVVNRLDKQDTRMQELSDKVSTMQGIGIGISASLGVLQLLGFIATVKASKEK